MSALVTPALLRPADVEDRWGVNALIYGFPGAGKTVFASTAQDVEEARDLLILDVEGGVRSIADRTDISLVRPTSAEEFDRVLDWLAEAEHTFRTIVVDSLSETYALVLRGITGGRPPTLQDYGRAGDVVSSFVRRLRAFSYDRGWNVVFTALTTEPREGESQFRLQPALSPRLLDLTCGAVDVVAYLEVKARTGERRLTLQGSATALTKMRIPRRRVSKPVVEIVDPTFADLLRVLQHGPKESEERDRTVVATTKKGGE